MLAGAANRDPAVFSHPDELDFDRGANVPSLEFGSRIHYRLGARLALLEKEVALRDLLARFPRMQPDRLGQLKCHRHDNLRGVESLHRYIPERLQTMSHADRFLVAF